jgi:hypothetical protein
MARHKPKYADAQPPKFVAASNFSGAVDQIDAYGGSLAYSLAAHRVNVGDTVVEYFGKGNMQALHEGLRSYDRQVKKLWKQLEDAAKKASGGAKSVLLSFVEKQHAEYSKMQFWGEGPDGGRYTEIQTEANPARSDSRRNKSSKKRNPVSVRKLVNDAMK